MLKYNFKKKKTRIVDANTAIRNIKKGQRILVGSGCAEPQHLVTALASNAVHFHDNEIVHLLTLGIAPYTDPKYSHAFRHNAFFIGRNVREAVSQGNADYIPIFLSEVPNLFKTGQMPLNCVLIQVSSPDSTHPVSLGPSVDILPAALENADIVIAQMNKNLPHTFCMPRIPLDCIDYLVEWDEPLLELPRKEMDDVS